VRQASFQDARNTIHDPILLGPPSLEFAPYAKTPGSRSRKDARQGTIDQDSDFIAFLESLTQPIARPAGVDNPADGDEKKKETILTTPLVQFIKDKKANKSKDSGSKSKHNRSDKDSKQEKVQAKKLLQRADKETPATSSEKKVKGEKPNKESAKTVKGNAASVKAGKSGAISNSTKESTAPPERKRERGNAAAATKILQRDLGLTTSNGRRRGKGAAMDATFPKTEGSRESSVPTVDTLKKEGKPSKNTSTTSNSTKSKDSESSSRPDAIPAPTPTKSTKGGKSKAPSTAKQAFLKHANPSQGVTEALLETAFTSFGVVTKVEIDKKKGFGYVDFAEPEGLRKAIAASPVSVAQSQVVVLERKENPGSEKSRKGREAFGANKAKAASETAASVGGGAGAGASAAGNAGANTGGNTGGNNGSSRGSRGGRGSRNKGPKGVVASEKGGEAK
jgi:regulator of nonsense transcripts 3